MNTLELPPSGADMPDALEELDAWLEAREAAFGDVRPEADARIIWADAPGVRTPLSIVYLHGYSASRMETAPLCDLLAARIGANLFYARLAGHGRSPDAMGEPSANCWSRDALEALEIGRRIGEAVVLIGCSTGGTLATLLAAGPEADAIAAVVLLAPNFGPRDVRSGLLTWPGSRRWVPWLIGRERVVEPENEAHGRYWTLRYPTTSLVPMMQLVRAVRRAPLERVRCPVLALWCEEDEVVDPGRIRPTLARMTDAHVETQTVPPVTGSSNHVFVGDAFGPHATGDTLERIHRFLGERGLVADQGSAGAK